jgi:CHASE2 domain-containing sensor protein
MQLATHYLKAEGIKLAATPDNYLKLGEVVFETLEKNTAGYRHLNANGHQILLNYRATPQIAETVTLRDVLNGQFDPNLVKDRIVLIGTTAPSFNDNRWRTSYGRSRGSIPTMAGVEVQAHMVSQILSAVLDGRPLIGWWSESGEMFWIGCWSLVGGLLALRLPSVWGFVLGGVVLATLYGSCWFLLSYHGVWVPLVPCIFALIASGGFAIVYIRVWAWRKS